MGTTRWAFIVASALFMAACATDSLPKKDFTAMMVESSARTEEPLPSLSPRLRELVGVWEGVWVADWGRTETLTTRLVVETVSEKRANVVYMWYPGGPYEAGWSRRYANIVNGDTITWSSIASDGREIVFSFQLSQDLKTLQAKRTYGGWPVHTTMRKAATSAAPPSTARPFGSAAVGQTPWPDIMPTLAPGKSDSPVAASLPANTEITPPGADVPAAKAAWSGKWRGWACRDFACDTKLAVEKVTTDGATIIYSFASAQVRPFMTRVQAKFVGDELQAEIGGGARVTYRMRSDANIEFLWTRGQASAAGILSKEK